MLINLLFLCPCSASEAESSYEQTQTMAERALSQAQEAYQDSLDIYSEATSLTLPEVNLDQLEAESQTIKADVSYHFAQIYFNPLHA